MPYACHAGKRVEMTSTRSAQVFTILLYYLYYWAHAREDAHAARTVP